MIELDEIFYAALMANETIVSDTGGRIFSTCVEVPPTEADNTPLPYIIIDGPGLEKKVRINPCKWPSCPANRAVISGQSGP